MLEMKPIEVKPQMKVIGPLSRTGASGSSAALKAMDPADVASQMDAGSIAVDIEGETIQLPAQAVEVEVQTLSAGEAVDILKTKAATMLIRR